MAPWMTMVVALSVFYVMGFLLTWAIREGGSYAFLFPNRKRKAAVPPQEEVLADSQP
ncbi:hypothetical protein P12x_001631 [Tundrisphaera lichenicola]|uniref:hypothetical protein n=1 Tax=Tundrisphaera lichenicola TaxID=2029860 RepID=UPI003EB7A2D8